MDTDKKIKQAGASLCARSSSWQRENDRLPRHQIRVYPCSSVVHFSDCQFLSESSTASTTGRIFTPVASSFDTSRTQFERGVFAAV